MATKGASATWLGGGPEGWLGKPPPNCSSMRTCPQQRVQMDVDLGRSIDRYVDILVADYVLGNHGATNRRTAIAAIDVDSHTARGGGVESVGKVSGNRIADDLVPTHVICRKPKRGSHVRVQRDASQPVTSERVPDDHVVGHAAAARSIGKHARPRTSNLHAVAGRDVLSHRIVVRSGER